MFQSSWEQQATLLSVQWGRRLLHGQFLQQSCQNCLERRTSILSWKHRHLTDISTSTKGFVAAVNKSTGLCHKGTANSKLFLCASIWFPATLMFPNYFPEPFLKCLGGRKYIIFSFCNPISFLNLRIKSDKIHGEDQHSVQGPPLH